jgi:hypothetical protein
MLTEATIASPRGGTYRIVYKDHEQTLTLRPGESTTLRF